MLVMFYGVDVADGRMCGYIKSSDLIDNFSESWIPWYQRERIKRAKKIAGLISVFKENKPIDALKLNLIGDLVLEKKEKHMICEGKFHVIDGQQRIRALIDSGVDDIKIPVELYVNLPIEKEVELYRQFNVDQTKPTFGDMIKSQPGALADLVRKALKSKDLMPVKITVNDTKRGLNISGFAPVLHWIHRKTIEETKVAKRCSGKDLLTFFSMERDKKEIELVEFAVKNLLNEYIRIFGAYDCRSAAYSKLFFLPCVHVFIDEFMSTTGKLDFGKYSKKVLQIPNALLKNAKVKEVLGGKRGDEVAPFMYDEVLKHLNHGVQKGRLNGRPSTVATQQTTYV